MKSMQRMSVALLALTAALAGYGAEPRADDRRGDGTRTNTWRVQVGWVHQWGRGMSVRGPAPSLPNGSFQSLTLGGRHVLSDLPTLTYPDNSLLIPREFDGGGYVRPDLWTGDTGVPAGRQGMTWNWGAGAGQYDYNGGVHPTLTYTIDRGAYIEPATTAVGLGGKSDDDFPSEGVEVKASRLLHSWASGSGATNGASVRSSLDLSLVVGLALFPGTRQKYQSATDQRVFDVRDTYTYLDYYGTAAGGGSLPLAVPYAGTYAGPGSLIPETPEAAAVDATVLLGTVRDSVAIKSRLWRLRGEAGIEFEKPLTDRLNLDLSPQIVLEFVDLHAERTETVTFTDGTSGATSAVASRTDRGHKMSVFPGALLTVGTDYRVSENWYVGASVGWEWLAEEPSVRVGPQKVRFELGGGEFSLYIGRHF